MIRAVIGVGPRTGTSFVMHKLEEAGLPVHCTPGWVELPDEGNPNGYYETNPDEIHALNDVIVKVWKPDGLNISRAVVLHRNRESQLVSMRKQMSREAAIHGAPEYSAEEVLAAFDKIDTSGWPEYKTEYLDEDIDEIIKYMEGG